MTDAEILERLREHFQTKVNNLSGDEMAEGPFEDGTEDGDLWEQAASRIDARGGLRVRFEFGDDSLADRMVSLVAFLEKGAQMLVDRVGQVDEVMARLRDEQATRLPLADAATAREERAAAEARPHDDEPTRHPGWECCPVCNPKPDDTVPQSCTFVHHGHRCTFRPGHHMLWHKLTDGTEVNDQGEPMEVDRG